MSSIRLSFLRSVLRFSLLSSVVAVFCAASPVTVMAQQAPAASPPKPTTPARPIQAAPAQNAPAQPTGPTIVQVKPESSQPDWVKVCGKDQAANTEVCYTTRDFVSDQGQPVMAVAVYETKAAQPQRIVRFLMPLGLLLQPGIRFAVDSGQATAGRYAICLPNGCFAEAQVNEAFIAQARKGTSLNVSVQNQTAREVTFSVPLAGFAKGFDGAPIDPAVLQEQQKKLQEELEKRSNELRQKLEQGAGAGTGSTPPKP
jgi:invasion protein IalB